MKGQGQRGFALIIVLWAVVLIGMLITQLTANGRTEARIAGNLAANAAAEAAADGAVATAVYRFLDADQRQHWPADDAAHRLTIGPSKIAVHLADLGGRVNPNLASDALLEALLREIGVDGGQAAALAGAITDWHDPTARHGAGEMAYRAAGLDYGPAGGPFETVEELGRVRGMTPDLLAALLPHISLWTSDEMPDADQADPVVRRALDRLPPQLDANPVQPQQQRRYTLLITATADGPSGARFTRQAVIRISPGLQRGYAILTWDTNP